MHEDRFSRLELLVGKEGVARLEGASVAVFGIGGVGSYAAEGLARAGIGRLTLVDFDTISLSNLNRQIHSLESTVGLPKVQVMAERCRAINPQACIEPLMSFYSAADADELLGRGYDYVLDCIDLITAKLHLIQHCCEHGIPIVSSMGAANKLDPTQICVADLFTTEKCRLARIMRKELRRRGITSGITVVYSKEEFRPLTGGRVSLGDVSAAYQSSRAPLGSCSWIPPIFGLTMAGVVVRRLLGEE